MPSLKTTLPGQGPAALLVVAALVAVYALYWPVLGAPLFFDDELITRDSFRLDYGQLLSARVRALSYHSIVLIERWAGAEHVFWQRVVNVALHAAVAASLFLFHRAFVQALARSDTESTAPEGTRPRQEASLPHGRWLGLVLCFLCLAFLLHPVAVYGTAYVVQRSILLATLFSVLALWATLRWLERGGGYALLAAVLLYLAAMASKEYALALPAAMLAIVIAVRRPSPRRVLRWVAPFAVLAAIAGYVLFQRYGALIGQPFDEASIRYVRQLALIAPGIEARIWPLSIANEMRLFFHYGLLWLVPDVGAMSIDLRPRFPTHFDDLALMLGVLGYLGALIFGVVGLFHRLPRVRLAAWAFFTVAALYVTEFATVWIQDPFVLYRSYLWALALPALVLVLVPAAPPTRQAFQASLAAGAVCVLALFAWLATDRVASMRSPLAVWSDAVAKLPEALTPGQSRAYFNRGAAWREAGNIRLALRDFEQSTRLGDGGEGLVAQAEWLIESGRAEQGLRAMAAALRRGVEDAFVFVNAGAALEGLGQADLALDAYRRAIESPRAEPSIRADAHARRALLSFALGRGSTEAIADMEQARTLAPNAFNTRLAEAYAALARGEAATAVGRFEALMAERVTLPAAAGLLQALKAAGQAARARTLLKDGFGALADRDREALQRLGQRLALVGEEKK